MKKPMDCPYVARSSPNKADTLMPTQASQGARWITRHQCQALHCENPAEYPSRFCARCSKHFGSRGRGYTSKYYSEDPYSRKSAEEIRTSLKEHKTKTKRHNMHYRKKVESLVRRGWPLGVLICQTGCETPMEINQPLFFECPACGTLGYHIPRWPERE